MVLDPTDEADLNLCRAGTPHGESRGLHRASVFEHLKAQFDTAMEESGTLLWQDVDTFSDDQCQDGCYCLSQSSLRSCVEFLV